MTTYSKEFKEQAIKLSDDIGLKKASDQLGEKYSTLAGWRKDRNKNNIKTIQADETPLTDRELQMQCKLMNYNKLMKF